MGESLILSAGADFGKTSHICMGGISFSPLAPRIGVGGDGRWVWLRADNNMMCEMAEQENTGMDVPVFLIEVERQRYNFNMQRKKFRISRKKFSKKEHISLQKRLDGLHARIRTELAGRFFTNPAEVIRYGREERDKQLLENIK